MPNAGALSFASDIRPLFTQQDVDHMQPFGYDLSDHAEVAKYAANILEVVTAGTMPPPGTGERWTEEMCSTFKRWMEEGCAP